jgi:hypothetical protein
MRLTAAIVHVANKLNLTQLFKQLWEVYSHPKSRVFKLEDEGDNLNVEIRTDAGRLHYYWFRLEYVPRHSNPWVLRWESKRPNPRSKRRDSLSKPFLNFSDSAKTAEKAIISLIKISRSAYDHPYNPEDFEAEVQG